MYDLVWSQPMTKVAEGFGISDVALKKICEKHRVPMPARGYWAKKNLAPEVREVLERERQRETATPKMKLPPVSVPQMPPIQMFIHQSQQPLRNANLTARES
jgi:hypothetical protein